MADLRRKQLPNLKISVDNTESTEESEDEVEIREENEAIIHDIEEEDSESSEGDSEVDKDVEFNVRIGSYDSKQQAKAKVNRDGKKDHSTNKSKSDPKVENKRYKSKLLPKVPEKRVYENKLGTFVTGIDVTSKEAQEKREERARRFRLQKAGPEQSALDIQALYASLGISEQDFENVERRLRKEAVHLRGTDDMSTKDIFDYFSEFPASGVEWINDTSCNVVWLDKVTSVRAMLKLSKSFEEVLAAEHKEIKKEKEDTEPEVAQERKEGDNDDAEKSKSSELSSGKEVSQAVVARNELMDVDDDELDLMDTEDPLLTAQNNTASGSLEKQSKTIPAADAVASSEKNSSSGNSKKKKTEEKEPKKKGERKEVKKKEDKNEMKGEKVKVKKEVVDSDEGSSSDSDSDSSSGSSGSSSSSGSSESSSSDSESDRGAEGSESDAENRKKRSSKQSQRDEDTGEIVSVKERPSQKNKKQDIPWPPGRWRLGMPCKKARFLFMRFAKQDDKKEVGAEKKSYYYRKYGNPNYGGMRGLISNSRKRRIRLDRLDKEVKSQGPDAREAIDKKRAQKQQQKTEGEPEEGELSSEDSQLVKDTEEGEVESEEEVVDVEKPKDLRQLLNRDSSLSSISKENSSLDKVVVKKRQCDDYFEEEELDLDAELEHLMERPAKKAMMMRMHADEEEERIKAQRSRTGLLTVVAAERGPKVLPRLAGRLGGRLQMPPVKKRMAGRIGQSAKENRRRNDMLHTRTDLLNSEDDYEEDVEDDENMDDYAKELASYMSLRNIPPPPKTKLSTVTKVTEPKPSSLGSSGESEGSLRSRLGIPAQARDSEKRQFPAMRIEVLDDEDEEED